MTTFSELKTQAAALLSDPSMTTFDTTDLGYFINAAIAQVSRAAPQKFLEDISLVEGGLSYPVRGGTGNLIANPSFEEGDDTALINTDVLSVTTSDDLLGGWVASATMYVRFMQHSQAKTGSRIGVIHLPASTTTKELYQDIPVNAGSTYYLSGWHWKYPAGGEACIIAVDTLDSNSDVVTADVITHSTTSQSPYLMSGSYTIPDTGVSYLRVRLRVYSAGAHATFQQGGFEDITLTEENTNLVATNALDSIEIRRVEVWSTDYDPPQKVGIISRGRGDSESGWDWWDGRLTIPYRWLATLDTSIHYLRVWGYAPYDKLTTATQVTDLSFELEQAVMEFVQLQALERLNRERDLFTQWQTRSGNSDVSPASLMSQLAQAREQWRRTKRDILVLREGQ